MHPIHAIPLVLLACSALPVPLPAEPGPEDAFARFDANGDDLVTHAELVRGKRFEFDRLDRNRDRVVTGSEFPRDELSRTREDPTRGNDPFTATDFEDLDRDGNRVLTSREYELAVHRIVNRWDRNADNAIDREEYARARSELPRFPRPAG